MPFGKYKSVDEDDDLAGYASNGFFVQATGNWLGKYGFGLAGSYCFQHNSQQPNADTMQPSGFYEPLGDESMTNHYLMAGPALIKSFGKLTLTVKLLVGGVLAYSPAFKIWLPTDSTGSGTPGSMDLSEGPGFGVAFQAQAGVGYNITNNLTLNLTFSYLGGNPSRTKDYYFYVQDEENGLLVYQGGEFQVKKKISTFNIGVGIAIKI